MMLAKIVKWLVIVFIGVIVLAGAAAAAVLILIDPNDYKPQITAAVEQATGRQFTLEGDLALSLFPWLGLDIGKAQLSNAAGFGAMPFAAVDQVGIHVKLLPLLRKEVVVDTVVLRGLNVQLARNAQGVTNWDDLVQGAASNSAPDESQTPAEGAPPVAAIAVNGLEIDDAHIVWDDRQADARYVIEHLQLRSGKLTPDQPVDLNLSFDLRSTTPPLSAHIAASTTLKTDLNAQRYTLQPFTLSVSAEGDALPLRPLQTELQADIAFDQAQDALTIDNLSLQTLNLSLKGGIDVQALSSAPAYRGRISIAPFSPRELLKSLQVPAPETADPAVLNKAAIDAALAGTADQVDISDLQITLDDTRINGKLGVRQFAQPAISFDLNVDAINVDRYLPPDSDVPPPTPETAAAGAAQLPLETLRALDINGLLAMGKLIVSNLTSEQISLGLRAKDGELRLTPIKATLYGGRFDGLASLDVRGDTPQLAVQESLNNIQAGPLLKDLVGDDKLSGTGSVTADLTASGVEPDALMASLNGTANFLFRDGAVKGVNIAQLIRSGYAKLKQQAAPAEETRQTDFAELSGSLAIKNGVVNNNDLAVKSPLLRIGGEGSANLPKQTVDYVVNTSIVGTLKGQAGANLDELKSVTIPVHITGSLLDPKFSVNIADALSAKAKAAIEEKKQQLQEQVDQKVEQQKQQLQEKKKELKDKAKDKLQDKLKQLL